jgi:hypothetical protein
VIFVPPSVVVPRAASAAGIKAIQERGMAYGARKYRAPASATPSVRASFLRAPDVMHGLDIRENFFQLWAASIAYRHH